MSLLPICSKIFQKLIFVSIYDFIDNNKIFNNNQSRFIPSNSFIHQLIVITHYIFDANPSMQACGVFLNLFKAFDRVQHDGLFFKRNSNEIDGNLFKLIESFLSNRYQRVLLNGQSFVWKSVTAGVPQDSVLRPSFFIIYIIDLLLGLNR